MYIYTRMCIYIYISPNPRCRTEHWPSERNMFFSSGSLKLAGHEYSYPHGLTNPGAQESPCLLVGRASHQLNLDSDGDSPLPTGKLLAGYYSPNGPRPEVNICPFESAFLSQSNNELVHAPILAHLD